MPKLSDLLAFAPVTQQVASELAKALARSQYETPKSTAPNRYADNRPYERDNSPRRRVEQGGAHTPGADYTPGSREYFEDILYGIRGQLPNETVAAKNKNMLLDELMYATPVLGEGLSARDAAKSYDKAQTSGSAWDYGNALLAGIGALPLAGYLARGTARGIRATDRVLPDRVNKLLDRAAPSQDTLYSGAPLPPSALPMDEASRLARAKEMGYSAEPFYRGEASGRLPGEYEGTPFFSRDKEYATGFAEKGGNAAPREFRLKTDSVYSDNAALTAAQYGKIVEAAAKNDPKLALDLAEQIAPGKGVDWLIGFGKARPDFVVAEPGSAALIRQAIERGSSDPVRVFRDAGFNSIDSGRDVRMLTGEGIRSKDARFDPSKASSRNIMAGVAGATVLPAYLFSDRSTSRQD